MISRLVIALVIAIVVGLVLSALLGPILVGLHVPIGATVGGFLIVYGWVLGVLAGLWSFFAGESWSARFRPGPRP